MLSLPSLCVSMLPWLQNVLAQQLPNIDIWKRQTPAPSSSVLVDFQVVEPVLTPTGSGDQYGCVYTQLLMDHSFGYSYGQPFVGIYNPPPCSFNRVTMNFTVTTRGRQFDRLGLMFLGDVEVFRTSTAEPNANGIAWTYIKEMQQYDVLWKADQKIIFDLGNLIDSTYTGVYNTTLTATFFTIPGSPTTADFILPISARQSSVDQSSAFQVPGQNASVTYTLPQNIKRAVVSLLACGQSTEEFWYTNVFTSEENTFAGSTGALYGGSPWREVQLLIDGQLAGVSWPFPIIFTGGIVPGFWRPIVGIDAFDLREHEIDVTPWLPILCDGTSHIFEIRVASLNDDGAGHATISELPGSYWVVTGKIFLFLDKIGSVTTGSQLKVSEPLPQFTISSSVTQNGTGANETLIYNTVASRDITITSTVTTSTGTQAVSWVQQLSYANLGAITAQGLVQLTVQNTTGADGSSSGYANIYSYPLNLNSSYLVDPVGDLFISGEISRSLDFNVFGPSVFPSGIQTFNVTTPSLFNLAGRFTPQSVQIASLPLFSGALLSTTQTASAEYYSSAGGNGSYSFGSTEQDFTFNGLEVGTPGATYELYHRHVEAVNSTVVEDEQTLAGQTFGIPTSEPRRVTLMPNFAGFSVKSILGRGPGKTKAELSGGAS